MAERGSNKDENWDVVVLGSGVAGLCAAIAASDAGAKTLLLEASATMGGTASWSGGALWVPANRHLLAAGGKDSIDAAVKYARACIGENAEDPAVQQYLKRADEVVAYLESSTPLELEVGTMPDYQGGLPGGYYEEGTSRSLAPRIFNLNRLGPHQALLRRSPYGTMPFGFSEFSAIGGVLHPERIDAQLFQQRLEEGYVGWGEALSASLLLAVLERQIEWRINTRGARCRRLADGFVLEVEQDGQESSVFTASLILACGGYEWDAELLQENFPGVNFVPSTVPDNRGDAWRIAETQGADIRNRGHCWGWPAYCIPGEYTDEGAPLVRTALFERTLPHMIIINSRGERFVDESLPYHAILKALLAKDNHGSFVNQPAFHVFDAQYREKYAFGPVVSGSSLPDWVPSAATPAELASLIGVDAEGFEATLDRFNSDVVNEGRDTVFNRGEHPYGRFWGDDDSASGPNLGTIAEPPYHAVPMVPSMIGTCGGPRIDENGRVIGSDQAVIPGLYAAGNATAAVSGTAYFGPGGTIGPAMVFGVLAGRSAAEEATGNSDRDAGSG